MSMFLMQHSASLFYLRRYDECVDSGRRAIEPPTPFPGAFVFLAAALVRLNRTAEAASTIVALKRVYPSYSGGSISALPAGAAPDTQSPTQVLTAAGLDL